MIENLCENPLEKKIYILSGGSGVGKTAILEEVMASSPEEKISCLFEVSSKAVHSIRLMAAVCAAIGPHLQIRKDKLEAMRKSLNDNSSDHTETLIHGFIEDLGLLTPKTAEALFNVLYSTHKDTNQATQASSIVNMAHEDKLVRFEELLKFCERLGLSGVICIDSAEKSSEDMKQVILGVLSQLPNGWSIFVSMNDETQDREVFSYFVKELKQNSKGSYEEHLVPSLEAPAIEEWLHKIFGKVPLYEKLQDLQDETQGRPFLIEQLLNNAPSIDQIPTAHQCLGSMPSDYPSHFENLDSDAAIRVIRGLAMLPSGGWFPHEFILKLARIDSSVELSSALAEAQEKLIVKIDPNSGGVRLYHDLIGKSIFGATTLHAKVEIAAEILKILDQPEIRGKFDESLLSFFENSLSAWTIQDQQLDWERLIASADILVRGGRIDAGLESLKSIETGLTKAIGSTENYHTSIESIRAYAFYIRGNYSEAIQIVEQLPISNKILLLKTKILVRLGQFERATKFAEAILKDNHRTTKEGLGAIRCLNTIERAKGHYSQASLWIEKIHTLRDNDPEAFGPKENCDIYRTEARTYCFIPERRNEALRSATQAKKLAKINHLRLELGNSHLAEGEVFRHLGKNTEARQSYGKAIECAEKLTNRDSLFWSCLGLADASLRSNDVTEARETLDKISLLVSRWGTERPFERAHYEFSVSSVKYIETMNEKPKIPRFYTDNEIDWPENYITRLIESPSDLPAKEF